MAVEAPGSTSTFIVKVVAPTLEIQNSDALPILFVGVTWTSAAVGVIFSPWVTETVVSPPDIVAVPEF